MQSRSQGSLLLTSKFQCCRLKCQFVFICFFILEKKITTLFTGVTINWTNVDLCRRIPIFSNPSQFLFPSHINGCLLVYACFRMCPPCYSRFVYILSLSISIPDILQFDIKLHRTFLKRTKYEGLRQEDLFVGSTITVYSRQLRLVGYGDQQTAQRLGSKQQRYEVSSQLYLEIMWITDENI